VATYRDEAKLKNLVFELAQRAADRNAGDSKVADAIMARCYPVILRAWRAKREALAAEYLDLADILRSAAPRLRFQPNPAKFDAAGKATVTVTAESSDKQFGSHRERMLAILQTLYGPGCIISVTDRWDSGGKEGGASNQQVYTYAKEGVYTVNLTESIIAGGSPLPKNDPLAFSVTLNTAVAVTVGSPKAAPVSTSKLPALQQLNRVTIGVYLPKAERRSRDHIDDWNRKIDGWLQSFSGGQIHENQLVGALVWSSTQFSSKGSYTDTAANLKITRTGSFEIEGIVDPEGTRVVKVTCSMHEDAKMEDRKEAYYQTHALSLVDVPILQPFEGNAVRGHIVAASSETYLWGTDEKVYNFNLDQLETDKGKASIGIGFYLIYMENGKLVW
jgi:hypothetical protein